MAENWGGGDRECMVDNELIEGVGSEGDGV